jgi:hypothetical protein
MQTLEARMAALEERLAASEQARERTERRLCWWKGAAVLTLLGGLLLSYPQFGQAQGGTVEQRLAVVEGKLARVFVVNGGNDLVLSGVNLNIINGLGDTQTTNGLGNLIIGYNEARVSGNTRTGSHNLVLGQRNNFASFCGIVGGFENHIGGDFACVLTGSSHSVGGDFSAVTGGFDHSVGALYAVVTGGYDNSVGGAYSVVTGGNNNSVAGSYSVVTGGAGNSIGGDSSTVSGGSGNSTGGNFCSVCGGLNRSISGPHDWRAGVLFQEN